MSWSKHSSTGVRRALDLHGDVAAQRDELRPGGIVEDLSIGVAKEQDSLAGDIDALVMALDARAALEIGITQSLGSALSIEAERDALVARLRAFTPLVRGTSAAHVARYLRADDAFHRIFLSLLRNQPLFDIYNAMDVPELMRRVLVVAPISIRELFDDHKALTNALRAGSADDTSAAITEHANRVRTALASFLAESDRSPEEPAGRASPFLRRTLDMRCTCVAYYARAKTSPPTTSGATNDVQLCEVGDRRRRPVPRLACRDARELSEGHDGVRREVHAGDRRSRRPRPSPRLPRTCRRRRKSRRRRSPSRRSCSSSRRASPRSCWPRARLAAK